MEKTCEKSFTIIRNSENTEKTHLNKTSILSQKTPKIEEMAENEVLALQAEISEKMKEIEIRLAQIQYEKDSLTPNAETLTGTAVWCWKDDPRERKIRIFNKIDENDKADLQVFADLYKSLNEVRRLAVESGDEATKIQVEGFMRECAFILNRESDIDLNMAETITNYIVDFVEANLMGAELDWEVSAVHHTINGDHPRTAYNASVTDAVPSKFTGDWGSPAPVSDGKNYNGGERFKCAVCHWRCC
jgi:hypothetical protein